METAIDGWRQAARVYADGQPTAAEGMLRVLLGTLRDGKEGGKSSHPSIETVLCAIGAAMEACGTAV